MRSTVPLREVDAELARIVCQSGVCAVGFEQDTGVRHSPEHNLWTSSTESTIPKEDRTYTVGCAFERLIPDEGHKQTIRDAVLRTHKATVLATELLNLHIRRCIEELDGRCVR